jgi:nitric oxide reductase NorE protein
MMRASPASPAAPIDHIPGEAGVWVFIFGDMVMFAIFFVTYGWYRRLTPTAYDHAQLILDKRFGLINTMLLLTSSWFVALALRASRRHAEGPSARFILVAMALGAGFVVAKALEWRELFSQGITVLSGEFFMYYFMFTGIHLVHVLIGLGVLAFLFSRVRAVIPPADKITLVESGGAFWHLVDVLWVVLFALLYLAR